MRELRYGEGISSGNTYAVLKGDRVLRKELIRRNAFLNDLMAEVINQMRVIEAPTP